MSCLFLLHRWYLRMYRFLSLHEVQFVWFFFFFFSVFACALASGLRRPGWVLCCDSVCSTRSSGFGLPVPNLFFSLFPSFREVIRPVGPQRVSGSVKLYAATAHMSRVEEGLKPRKPDREAHGMAGGAEAVKGLVGEESKLEVRPQRAESSVVNGWTDGGLVAIRPSFLKLGT